MGLSLITKFLMSKNKENNMKKSIDYVIRFQNEFSLDKDSIIASLHDLHNGLMLRQQHIYRSEERKLTALQLAFLEFGDVYDFGIRPPTEFLNNNPHLCNDFKSNLNDPPEFSFVITVSNSRCVKGHFIIGVFDYSKNVKEPNHDTIKHVESQEFICNNCGESLSVLYNNNIEKFTVTKCKNCLGQALQLIQKTQKHLDDGKELLDRIKKSSI